MRFFEFLLNPAAYYRKKGTAVSAQDYKKMHQMPEGVYFIAVGNQHEKNLVVNDLLMTFKKHDPQSPCVGQEDLNGVFKNFNIQCPDGFSITDKPLTSEYVSRLLSSHSRAFVLIQTKNYDDAIETIKKMSIFPFLKSHRVLCHLSITEESKTHRNKMVHAQTALIPMQMI